jgi:hypothetical protein
MKGVFFKFMMLAVAVAAAALPMRADVENGDSVRKPDGKYIYIPDSLEHDVIRLLLGHAVVVDNDNNPDLKEVTIYKGDTIPMVLKTRNLGRYDRGLSNILYAPRGQWMFGLTAAYGNLTTQDLSVFDLLSDVDFGISGFSIKPYFSYFFKNNYSVGLRLGYSYVKGSIDSFNIDIDDDLSFSLNDIYYKQADFSAAFLITQFLGLTRHGRFGIYNEAELAFSSGNSEFRRPYGGEPKTTYTSSTKIALNFSPGVQVFVMKNVSFHVSLGAFGLYLKSEKQHDENNESTANRFTSGASFKFNLFNINFGIGVHI